MQDATRTPLTSKVYDVEDFAVEVAKVGAHACQAGGSARQANLQPKKQRTISGPAGSLR